MSSNSKKTTEPLAQVGSNTLVSVSEQSNTAQKQERTIKDLLDSPAAQACVENNYTISDVETAVKMFIEMYGHTHFKAEDIVRILDPAYKHGGTKDTVAREAVSEKASQDVWHGNVCRLPCGHLVQCPCCIRDFDDDMDRN